MSLDLDLMSWPLARGPRIATFSAFRAGVSWGGETAECHITGSGGVCGEQSLKGQLLSQQLPRGNVSPVLQPHPTSKAEVLIFM